MNDNHHGSGQDAHAVPTHNVFKKALNLAVLLVLPVIVVGVLVGYYRSYHGTAGKHVRGGGHGADSKGGGLQSGGETRELKTDEQVYNA